MLIVDAFLGNDEIDLARFRFGFLEKDVSLFYVGESKFTFSGKSKPLHFSNLVTDFPEFRDRIVPLEIVLPDNVLQSGNRWVLEEFSRDFLLKKVLEKHPEDVIIFSDLDEIPSLDQILELKNIQELQFAREIPMRTSVLFANWEKPSSDGAWGKAKAIKGRFEGSGLRYRNFTSLEASWGIHFSYLGMDATKVKKKYAEFSHEEYDEDQFSSQKLLDVAREFRINHTGRAHDPSFGLLHMKELGQLSHLQKAMYEQNPNWIDVSSLTKPLLRRIVASWSLTKFVHRVGSDRYAEIARSPWWSSGYVMALGQALSYSVLRALGLAKLGRILKPIFARGESQRISS